jgi:glycosyltransferase involved in cell wall biosynthesis
MSYSVVIPIYNEQAVLPELYRRLRDVLEKLDAAAEVILIDDGSSDDSFRVMEEIHRGDSRIKLVRLARNFGHQPAISAGLDLASGDAVILMDGDLQDPPELFPQMISKWKEGYHVVYTVKRSRKENILKRFAFSSFYKCMHSRLFPFPWKREIFLLSTDVLSACYRQCRSVIVTSAGCAHGWDSDKQG